MPDNLGLLLDAIAFKRPAGLQGIVITPRERAVQRQVPPAARLCLPDMGHLVNEQALPGEIGSGKIVAVVAGKRVEVDVAAGRHHHVARLEREPALPPDAHRGGLDGRTEHRADQRHFARSQPAFAAGGAGIAEAGSAQWSMPSMPPPMASIFIGAETLSPSAKVTVSSVVPPALSLFARSKTMTCNWPGSNRMLVPAAIST